MRLRRPEREETPRRVSTTSATSPKKWDRSQARASSTAEVAPPVTGATKDGAEEPSDEDPPELPLPPRPFGGDSASRSCGWSAARSSALRPAWAGRAAQALDVNRTREAAKAEGKRVRSEEAGAAHAARRTAVGAVGSAPWATSSAAEEAWADTTAQCSALSPSWGQQAPRQPMQLRNATTCQHETACRRALSVACTSAPWSSRAIAASSCPPLAANINAV